MHDGCRVDGEIVPPTTQRDSSLLFCRPPTQPFPRTHVQPIPNRPTHTHNNMRTHTRTHRHLALEDRREFYRMTVWASLTDRAPPATQFLRVRAQYDPT